jgi:phosphopantothenoylcysteine decarboxylase/phosphopantothenate--cysteine ligase
MNHLFGKRVLLGVTGGIAAYKSAELVRLLRTRGAEVQVVMTPGACEFITPVTMQALSGRAVYVNWTDGDAAIQHIDLARWPDLVLIAPATADTLSRLAQGRAERLLDALCLATTAPISVAPAMNRRMWDNAATQANVALLTSRGISLLGPADGEQACGETGPGRMLEPEALVQGLAGSFATGRLSGLRVLITAGPTREAIDPVRCLTNRSSGKTGYAIAAAAREAGASVTLVSGPVDQPSPEGVERICVESAVQMHAAVMQRHADCDIFIATAAVADYRPAVVAPQKIKKHADRLQIDLERNPDILADVAVSGRVAFCVGFAAETEQVEKHARKKRLSKSVDLIVANQVGPGQGFDVDDNSWQLFWEGGHDAFPDAPKTRLARRLVALIADLYDRKIASCTGNQDESDTA